MWIFSPESATRPSKTPIPIPAPAPRLHALLDMAPLGMSPSAAAMPSALATRRAHTVHTDQERRRQILDFLARFC